MKALSGELDYRIRYDVEHDLFHAQNVFNDEYITPTFVEYVQELEKKNAELLQSCEGATMMYKDLQKANSDLTTAKEIIMKYLAIGVGGKITQNYLDVTKEAEQFLKVLKGCEVEK